MEMTPATPVSLPSSTLYPVVITALLKNVGDDVPKHTPILRYKYWNFVDDPEAEVEEGEEPRKIEKEFHSTFESPISGKLTEWKIKVGDEVSNPQ